MKYLEDRMAEWDEYAIQKTAQKEGREEGREEGRQEGREEKEKLFVTNLLKDGEFSISKIAALADVNESFVRRIKKELKIR